MESSTVKNSAGDQILSLVGKILSAEPQTDDNFVRLKDMVDNDFIEYGNFNDSYAEEASAVRELQSVAAQLETLSHDTSLICKTNVAIAGGFSSGKSSFINSLFVPSKVKLPIDMQRTTAICAYVLPDDQQAITGYSYKGGAVDIPSEFFYLFSHRQNDKLGFHMKQIVDHIVFKNKFVKTCKNICFIDTPGFNPGVDSRDDYDMAMAGISQASGVIWCVNIEDGTIHPDSLAILSDIMDNNHRAKIYVLLTHAENRSQEERQGIIEQIQMDLDDNGIEYSGIQCYDSQYTFNSQPAGLAAENIEMSLVEFLEELDIPDRNKLRNAIGKVRAVFDNYMEADNNRIQKLQAQKRLLQDIENAVGNITNASDEKIQYLKARLDSRFRSRNYESDSTDNSEEQITEILGTMIADCDTVINHDRKDLEKAKELCDKMCAAVYDCFGQKYEGDVRDLKKGDIKQFGSWGGEKISWQVLGTKGNSVMMLAQNVIDAKPYNADRAAVSWEKSSLRQWLNSDFYKTAFNAEERTMIVKQHTEFVTILSKEELCQCAAAPNLRRCNYTEYAQANGLATEKDYCYWWLRDIHENYAIAVKPDGNFAYAYVDSADVGVCPVIWIEQ